APPCYAERTVPDLLERLEYLTPATGDPAKDGRVVFSCHSQGCVIGTAVLLQARTRASERTALLTYGNPVTRLYVRFFPAYFDVRTLRRLGELLTDDGRWRWNNLYRPSDPIGGWVIVDDPLPPHAAARPRATAGCLPGGPDRQLLDPRGFALRPGDSCYEQPLGHSDYFADQAYGDIVLAWRNSTAQQPVPGPEPAARPVAREETPRVSAVRPWWPWQRLRPY
ncbi:hypothetical protein GRC12_44235, partial [Streptomyces griseorubiginosus]|nr:hypothetical protein [Streptomyces griseorubiginosus]